MNMKVTSLLCISGFCIFLALGNPCGPNEYKSAEGECCPMCSIGSMVVSDCIGDTSTTCTSCISETFMSEPSGLKKCFACSHCAKSQGLDIQSKCTKIRDTICEVLDGYYCIDYSNLQCSHAIKHSVCKPGQEIKTPGTKTSDTECKNCSFGFYSSSGLNCTKWTDCAARNEIQSEDGSPVKDVKCVQKRKRYCLVAFCPPVICAVVLAVLYGRSCSDGTVNNGDKINRLPIEETNPESETTGTLEEKNTARDDT
ncbi:tumor necrosis factor receptor superfamily member 14-like [Pimephales promelas]|uniref:tumor necrosis factor receptor superfamily member 14-like n=1 Tax=Pimephales promelas TaxID=90988 RepID=UPI00195571E1|nr:tumor necrosis factor receptor superfamily member 14-like [Pimephales promelas]